MSPENGLPVGGRRRQVGTRECAVMPGDSAGCFSWGILFYTR